jgi:ketosteroid isomerase-like protein
MEVNMKQIIISGIFLLLISLPAFSQNVKNEEVTSLVKKMIEAQSNFDSTTLDKLYASDYIEISPIGEVDERAKAIGFYKVENSEEAKKMSPKSGLDEFNVRNYGKFTIVIAKLTFSPKDETQKMPTFSMRIVFVCRKEKGNWKISSAQFTGIRPPRPQPAKQ